MDPSAVSHPYLSEWEHFCRSHEALKVQNRFRVDTFFSLRDELAAQGIKVLPLKGLELLLRAYPSLGLRDMTDMDLLIQPDHAPKVKAFLDQKNLLRIPDEGLTYVSNDRTVNFDISWNLWFLSASENEKVWKRCVRRIYEEKEVTLLSPEDSLIYLLSFIVLKRGVLRESLPADLEFFLQMEGGAMDWDMLSSRIRTYNLAPAIHHACTYVESIKPGLFPKVFTAAMRPKNSWEEREYKKIRTLVTDELQPKVNYALTWRSYPGWAGKMRLLREKILPNSFELEVTRAVKGFPNVFCHRLFYLPRILLKLFFKN